MKIYVKASMSYNDLCKTCKPIQSEIVKALRKINPNLTVWNHGFRDNRDGTVRVSIEIPDYRLVDPQKAKESGCSSVKEARKLMLDAISMCSKELQDSVVKVTCGPDGDRGVHYFVVSAHIRPSTNDYYGVHDIE